MQLLDDEIESLEDMVFADHVNHSGMQRRSLRYYQDLYDHVLRASVWTESLRDLVTTIRETQPNL